MGRPKQQFCPQGHDTFITGRSKHNGGCIQCDKNRHRKDPTKDSRIKDICINGHEIAIVGRDENSHCNECKKDWFIGRSDYNKEYYERTHDYQLARAKEYRDENQDRIKKYQRQYSETHREQIRKHRKKNSDQPINTQLALLLRNRLNRAISQNYKAGSAVADLGCSIPFFKDYIESLFTEGMTWDNRGFGNDKWNIDHIIPLSSFDLTDRKQFLTACYYTNMQPMWQPDNLRKSNKILTSIKEK